MNNFEWKKTTVDVYNSIFAEHNNSLAVYSSFTDPDGSSHAGNGKPQMTTEWAFVGSDFPILKTKHTKEDKSQKDWDIEYFIRV